jgi:protein-S-isoprenylcysteine O-methyltransferase Ste14
MLSFARRSITVVAGSAIYLGLTLLSWGNIGVFLSHSPLIALLVVFVALSVAAIFAGGSLSSGLREDRSNRWVLVVFAILGILTAIVPPWSDSHNVLTVDGDSLRWIGVVVLAIGGALRLWPVVALGHRFSGLVAIQPNHTLLTNGPFRYIRHPSYLGLLLSGLGWALAFRSILGVPVMVLHLIPVIARISAEEELLRSEFGSEYEAYRARTSRLLPGIY